jgi:hypothetical protein
MSVNGAAPDVSWVVELRGFMLALDSLRSRLASIDGPDAGERHILAIIIGRLELQAPGESDS